MRNRDYEVKQYFLEIDFSEYENRKNVVKKMIYSENDINTAFINVQLKNNGKIMDLSNYDVIANIWKNTGNKVDAQCNILNAKDGEVEVPLTREALKGAGINPFTIMAINSEGSLESPRFYYRVEEGLVNDDDIENADEFGVLVLLISQVKEVLKDNDILVTRVENLENLIEEQEEIREANELVRKENEEVRKTSEETREANELVRKENEEVRKTSEETREANELVRKESEEVRKESEETREANELVRRESEEVRKASEETREANELVRRESEEVRKTSEETREANELVRKENEEVRKTQEIDRQDSIKRMEKELIDKTDEKFNEVDITLDNKLKEQQKQIDDKIVETNNKINEVDTKIAEVDNKIVEVNTAKTDMTTTVSNKLTEFEQRFEELESTNTTGEIIQTREAYDGTQKNTLKERFTYDFDKVYEKIAEMSSAATNIAFSKSYSESDWIADEEYFKLIVNHNLVTENIYVAILNEAIKKSMTNSYTIIDNNTIEIFNELAISVKVTVVNGNTNKEVIQATINDNITTLDSTYSSVKIDAEIDEKASESLEKINENKANIASNLEKINLIQDKTGSSELNTISKNISDAVNELDASVKNLESGGNVKEQIDSLKSKYDTLSNKVLDIAIYLELESGSSADEVGHWFDGLSDNKGILSIDESLKLDTKNRKIQGVTGSVTFNRISIPFQCNKLRYIHELNDNYIESISEKKISVGTTTIDLDKYSYEIK
ncbi:TPA: phage tail protein [Clostridioides difficile]